MLAQRRTDKLFTYGATDNKIVQIKGTVFTGRGSSQIL